MKINPIERITPEFLANSTKYCKNYVVKSQSEEVRKSPMWGYSIPTLAIKRVAELGAENFFIINEDYHGLYEDDYCYFSYYNNVTGAIEMDEWTTAGACPHFDNYHTPMTFMQAVELGYLNMDKFVDGVKKRGYNFLNRCLENTDGRSINLQDIPGLKVKVAKGRKWKGEGYVVSYYEKSYRYYTPMYRTNNSSFGVSSTKIARVYDPTTDTINDVTASNLVFLNQDKIVENYKKWATEKIEGLNTENLNIKIDNIFWIDIEFNDYLKSVGSIADWSADVFSSVSSKVQEELDEAMRRKNEFKVKKIGELIDWSKGVKPELSDEERLNFAEKIFEKKYGEAR